MLNFEKVDMSKNLCNFLAALQRLLYIIKAIAQKGKKDILKEMKHVKY